MVVRSFKGKVLVDIREFYEDDSGVSRPGRKGDYLEMCHCTLQNCVWGPGRDEFLVGISIVHHWVSVLVLASVT